MTILSKLAEKSPSKLINSVILGFSLAGCALYVAKRILSSRKNSPRSKNVNQIGVVVKDQKYKKEKAAVDMVFFARIYKLLSIAIPGLVTWEVFYLTLVSFSLIARTYCDLWIVINGTNIEGSIIDRDYKKMMMHLLTFIMAMPLISIINNLLKYGLSEIKICFRQRLTHHLMKSYLQGQTYYKMANLDNRISNADQLLTQDIQKFCDCLGDLYSNISKPVLDIIIFTIILARSVGLSTPGSMLIYMLASGSILTALRRPISDMVVKEQQLEGEYRYVNSRIITNSEEIAFYQGDAREKLTVNQHFTRLVAQLRRLIRFQFAMGFVDNIVAKYLGTAIGYLSVSIPFFDFTTARFLNASSQELREDYFRSGRYLLRLALAVGRLALAGRDMTHLAGYTQRVTQLRKVMLELDQGKYERTMVEKDNDEDEEQLMPGAGEIVVQDRIIMFEGVPLVTPNGDVLVKSLDFQVQSGMNVLVCGPNGCGKSSLFRILGELWPMFGGKMTKPPKDQLFYIPQRPYMTLGTFRDQVIYPDNYKDMTRKGFTDDDLRQLLEQVQLLNLLEREGGWDAILDWMDVLSGGEKQRVAMARLFYNHPQFAILDECTSAVSMDVEASMYQHCRKEGITLFTVSHRKSLWQHHEYVMKFDGRGTYEFRKIDETDEYGT